MEDTKGNRNISCDLDIENGLPAFLGLNMLEYSWRKADDQEASLFKF